ncbi:MAG: DUF2252 family protein [Bacteriovorax sp.]|nr:DUF2252 family protein [Bacteriovorax sp.]
MISPVGLKDFSSLGGRVPASVNESTPCYQLLESFYSSDRNQLLDARIKYAEGNSHLFYRSFPPMYYKLIEKNKWEDKFSSMVRFKSVITGDSHMENFGLKFYNGKLRFSVNDYDDLTKGPVFLDLVRLLTSAKLAGIDVDRKLVEEFFTKFKKGLNGKKHSYSKTIEDLIDESKKVGMIDDNVVDVRTKFFKKKKTPNTPLSASDLEKWNSILSEHGVITDSYLYIKEYGGSGGLRRFEFAIEKDGQMKLIEAKEWAEPSYDVATNVKGPGDKERYNWIINYDKPIVASKLSSLGQKLFT